MQPIGTLRDEIGVELYCRAGITPWIRVTPDLQIARRRGVGANSDTTVILVLRATVVF